HRLAGAGVETPDETLRIRQVDVSAGEYRAADPLRVLTGHAPQPVRGRDVPLAPGFYRQDRPVKARGPEDHVPLCRYDRRRIQRSAQAHAAPQLGARGRIVALDPAIAADAVAGQ